MKNRILFEFVLSFFVTVTVYVIAVTPMSFAVLFATQIFEASSESMEPAINKSDVFVASNQTSFETLNLGNIIAFTAPDPNENNKIIVSRITAIIEEGGYVNGNVEFCAPMPINDMNERTILTQGDANECSIPGIDFPVTKSNYIGNVSKIYSPR